MSFDKAILALADGTTFLGKSIGSLGETNGEVVFNTSMTGYQEILTDPSYAKQIVTLTYPHIGNTGVNSEDVESDKVWASGLVIKDLPIFASNWRKEIDLTDYLIAKETVAISDIDTRKLTSLIRKKGAQSAAIISGKDISEQKAVSLAQKFLGLKGLDLAKEVTTKQPYLCCLLYTSDAADERSSVDLGGRRIIKKKKRTSKISEVRSYDFNAFLH